MRTQKDFERDFAELIELGDIFIENDCITEQVDELVSLGYDLVAAITIASDPNYLD